MACGSTSTGLVNRNGPGSAASSIVESIVKPAEATGGKAKCFEYPLLYGPPRPLFLLFKGRAHGEEELRCDGVECCCIPIPCTVM
ncbi:hypothetical protein CCHR01_15009 [Colletotrichum chrysophilum]|uniref:Uncharacterized protein n=1 Tax=Colletotrichum chrysophilum TaxID=1836956 RepID=A0AAD9A6G2_9PEZI|nr:hypothetical protein CCHR01_15009 [Colletotrichum chrysophilum]